ncbi:hypothetical protein BGX31_006670 [Mortierella sp. GBA43]|nr:hypothetical protein BGX31_006670 [Mortierella sp. GBA43]
MQEFVPGLNYFFIGTLDRDGRPWVSMLTGEKGFLYSPHSRTLEVRTRLETGKNGHGGNEDHVSDPIFSNLLHGEAFKDGKRMFGGVGLDFTNRRRNKMNGVLYPDDLLVADEDSGELHVRLTVEQTMGNCPKYITIREVVPRPQHDRDNSNTTPVLVGSKEEKSSNLLSEEAKAIVRQADCFFISSRFIDEDLADQTSGMDCNHRGGNPGFVRMDGNNLLLPDYSGNRFFNTLGNITNDERLGLLFLNFESGDLLHLTGRGRIFVGQDAQALYPHTQRCVQVTIDDYVIRKDALPFRMKTRELSPYNPTVSSGQHRIVSQDSEKRVSATLSNITRHTEDLATFRFTTSRPIRYIPGQYAVLDLSQFNTVGYRHMAPNDPQSLNDDYVRTWTISSAPTRKIKSVTLTVSQGTQGLEEWEEASEFTMTIKRKPGGAVSNLLHDLVLNPQHPFNVPLISTGGSFVLPTLSRTTQEGQSSPKIALISGGIGSTPFISMIRGARQAQEGPLDIQWITSAPYLKDALPEVLQELTAPLESTGGDQGSQQDTKPLALSVNVFLTRESSLEASSLQNTKIHYGRLSSQDIIAAIPDIHDRQVLLCGPDPFMESIKGYLQELRVPISQILVEDFNF